MSTFLIAGLSAPLPANVHLLTVHGGQGKAGQQLLIRLAHLYEVDEDATLSRNATINVSAEEPHNGLHFSRSPVIAVSKALR